MVSLTKSVQVLSDGSLSGVKPRLPVLSNPVGIIIQDLVTPMERSRDVQACPMNDAPKIGDQAKDSPYLISDAWVLYMKKLMSQRAWDWWIVYEFMLMINRPSKWGSGTPDQMPKFELIALPCNFVELDKFVTGYGRVVSRDSVNFDTSKLDPSKDNWFYRPSEFWKATMHDDGGNVYLVGDSDHVYTPNVKQKPEVWINLKRVEMFPTLPMDVTYDGKVYTITGYCLQGASVYGHSEEIDIPLRLARVPGELIHPCPEWRLKEKPVPPEVRPEWQ